ncbi:hypothetical protein [Agrobacterium rosae]|uniref:Uncharacterized protein n=1 Tax=Agrobacterium rosae TaxID=1972867 RepID=A0AAE5RTB5_9HYPH|nr:hypothetical protein [Agrobacterium rosae]KAA3509194.1 hypothetical protein DXM21_22500 [Agrobacterium rosae]KAA3513888.1 hypothetical protein DXM25_22690 [Agrobacterium rosae]MQB50907.1 hypothetical protein [Agrobacterium rosae]POO48878.1 hypothetical protein CPJ18_23160 [Agrobacterium rosae]
MEQIEYLYDDVAAAKSFVLSLKLKVIRERFSSLQDWNPDNCVLAMVRGRPVALADCNRTEDGLGAICGLISRPGFGGYAVCALSALKRRTRLQHWAAGIREPNPAVLGIARRFLDELYDQGAWEIANELMLVHGPLGHLRPTPLVISTFHLKHLGLPPIGTWSSSTKRHLLEAARAPGTVNLVSPSGDGLGPLLMTFAFEIADTPGRARLGMTRTMMFMMMAMHGITVPEKLMRKFMIPSAPRDFQQSVDKALSLLDDSGPSLFSPQKMDMRIARRNL